MKILLGCPEYDRSGMARLLRKIGPTDLAEPFQDLASIALHCGPYDVVVLSVADVRGQAVPALRDLRRFGVVLPVIVLTAGLTPDEEGSLLDLGADDVLARALAPGVLAARLRAALRRSLGHASSRLACGNVELDQASHTVRVDGRQVAITRREFDILEMLMLRRGMLVTKDGLMNRLYGDEETPDPRILDVFVCKLRRKLAAVGAAEMVRTVWGRGYAIEEPEHAVVEAARAQFAAGLPLARRPGAHPAMPSAWRQPEAPAAFS